MAGSLRSPPFEFVISSGSIAAGATLTYDWENTNNEAAFFSPFNTLLISNFSGQRLKVTYAGGHFVIVRPNSSMVIEQYGIRSVNIQNMDALNANDDIIEIIAQREVTAKHIDLSRLTGIPLSDVINGVGW